jgi:membrane-associated phospholipid phosphatase
MSDYKKLISDFLKQSRSTGIVDYIVKGSLLLYTFLLFSAPLTIGKIPVPTPEQVIFLVLTYAVFVGKGVGFIRDLAPLVILFFAYEAMRGVVVANEQRVITEYWSSSQSMNGLEVNTTPRLMNIGDALSISVRDYNAKVDYVDVLITRVGGGKATTEIMNLKLEGGTGSYFVTQKKSGEIFEQTGVYNITASAHSDAGINGSSTVGITQNVHYKEPIEWERAIFGTIPSAYLQERFYREGSVSLMDIISVLAYCVHFLIPFGFACLVWFEDRELYKKYSATFLILTYASLITFLLYPAAPPWLAGLTGYLDGVKKIYHETSKVLNLVLLPTLYYWINANEVAALPSLHAAFPLLIAIYSVKLWGRKGWLVFLYPLATAFSLVYLGEHYAVDVLLGFLYVFAAMALVDLIFKWENRQIKPKRKVRGKR